MSHLFQVSRVQLLCFCGMLKPITAIYFCRHCLKLRCSNCVSHEVDTLYCPNCLENMPVTEAYIKKNRCANCFDCPSCGQTLSSRAATQQVPSPEDETKLVARKVYYLLCTCCRWSSRDVALKDQTSATGGWTELENPNHELIQSRMEYYRAIAQKEKFEKEKKRFPQRKSMESQQIPESKPSVATEEIESLPDLIFSEPTDLTKVTTIEQRLASPEFQPERTLKLYPLHKHILVRRSLRCRNCEHNLSKPEYNPSSIKFKIQLSAFYHVPEVRLVKEPHLNHGQVNVVHISLCNPTPHDMTVTLLPYIAEAYVNKAKLEESKEISQGSGSLVRVVDILSEKVAITPNCDVILPQGQLILAARDDTAEYDDQDSNSKYNDDPEVVAWRRSNKVGVKLLVTTKDQNKECRIAFVLHYEYTNTIATVAESKAVTLNIPIMISMGIASSS